MNLAKAYPDILKTYLAIATELAKAGSDAGGGKVKEIRILKTDCFNEATGRPKTGGIAGNIPGEVQLVDVRPDYIAAAKKLGLNAELGDIRWLHYPEETFDIILDFSTIDHVRNWILVLKEYSRVLKPGGQIAIVAWTMPSLEYVGQQFYFPEMLFREKFKGLFGSGLISVSILYEDDFRGRRRKLIAFIGTKPGGKPESKPEPEPDLIQGQESAEERTSGSEETPESGQKETKSEESAESEKKKRSQIPQERRSRSTKGSGKGK